MKKNIDISRYLWDYNITSEDFLSILSGQVIIGGLDRDWAAVRLLNYATYEEIIHLIGYKDLVDQWKVRSPSERLFGYKNAG